MLEDRYGLSLSTRSTAALDAYQSGLDLMLRGYPGAATAFGRAIEADAGLALAHAGQARALQLAGDPAGAQAAIAAAQQVAGGATEREASHVEVLALLIAGKAAAALSAVRRHAERWPRDALIVGLAANQTGLIGMSGRAGREQEQLGFLAALAPHYGEDWWFNGHYAMALAELGDQVAARPRIERSMADQPHNASGAHALAHILYEAGDHETTVSFLQPWLADYPASGMLSGHLNWHVALALLQQGDHAGGLRLFDSAFAGADLAVPALIKLLDGPSYLWRAELAGHPRDLGRWQALRDFSRRLFPRPGVPFADWHMALIDAVMADDAAETRAAELDKLVAAGSYSAGPTVAAAARGFAAFERRDHVNAIAALESMMAERERLSGSRAQLDLVEFTLLKAYLVAGREDDARRLQRARRPGAMAVSVAGVGALAA
jgi:hypothetical protein